MTALGSFDNSLNYYDTAEWIFFFLCAIFNITLLLNLLIAIISQTYEEVEATQIEALYSEKVNQIVHMQATFLSRYKTINDPMKLLFIARVISDDINNQDNRRKINIVKNELMKFNERRFEGVQESISEVKVQMKSMQANIKSMQEGMEETLKGISDDMKAIREN